MAGGFVVTSLMTITKLRMRVPDLRAQVDVTQIHEILSAAPGIEQVVADYETGVVDISTAAQDGGEYTIRLLSKGGYPPSEVQPVN
jgi:hypothetical protein